MLRTALDEMYQLVSVPHTRGDEPYVDAPIELLASEVAESIEMGFKLQGETYVVSGDGGESYLCQNMISHTNF